MDFTHGPLNIEDLGPLVGFHLGLDAKNYRLCHWSGYAPLDDHDLADLDLASVRRIKDTFTNLVGLLVVLNGMKILRDGRCEDLDIRDLVDVQLRILLHPNQRIGTPRRPRQFIIIIGHLCEAKQGGRLILFLQVHQVFIEGELIAQVILLGRLMLSLVFLDEGLELLLRPVIDAERGLQTYTEIIRGMPYY